MTRKKDRWAVVMMHAGKWATLMNCGYDTRWFEFTRDWTTDTLTRDDTEGKFRLKSEEATQTVNKANVHLEQRFPAP